MYYGWQGLSRTIMYAVLLLALLVTAAVIDGLRDHALMQYPTIIALVLLVVQGAWCVGFVCLIFGHTARLTHTHVCVFVDDKQVYVHCIILSARHAVAHGGASAIGVCAPGGAWDLRRWGAAVV